MDGGVAEMGGWYNTLKALESLCVYLMIFYSYTAWLLVTGGLRASYL